MRYRKLLLLLLAAITAVTVSAQVTVHGVVLDENNDPVIGATAAQKGKPGNGAATDIDGKFTLTVPNGSTIVVTYVGYETAEVKAQPNVTVNIKPKGEVFQEVVVTGYGNVDKRLFAGATSSVDASKTKLSGVADASRGLEGRVSGVQVQNVSGTFGTAPKIRVRGATSIYGSSRPLWVVDGVILEDNV